MRIFGHFVPSLIYLKTFSITPFIGWREYLLSFLLLFFCWTFGLFSFSQFFYIKKRQREICEKLTCIYYLCRPDDFKFISVDCIGFFWFLEAGNVISLHKSYWLSEIAVHLIHLFFEHFDLQRNRGKYTALNVDANTCIRNFQSPVKTQT